MQHNLYLNRHHQLQSQSQYQQVNLVRPNQQLHLIKSHQQEQFKNTYQQILPRNHQQPRQHPYRPQLPSHPPNQYQQEPLFRSQQIHHLNHDRELSFHPYQQEHFSNPNQQEFHQFSDMQQHFPPPQQQIHRGNHDQLMHHLYAKQQKSHLHLQNQATNNGPPIQQVHYRSPNQQVFYDNPHQQRSFQNLNQNLFAPKPSNQPPPSYNTNTQQISPSSCAEKLPSPSHEKPLIKIKEKKKYVRKKKSQPNVKPKTPKKPAKTVKKILNEAIVSRLASDERSITTHKNPHFHENNTANGSVIEGNPESETATPSKINSKTIQSTAKICPGYSTQAQITHVPLPNPRVNEFEVIDLSSPIRTTSTHRVANAASSANLNENNQSKERRKYKRYQIIPHDQLIHPSYQQSLADFKKARKIHKYYQKENR